MTRVTYRLTAKNRDQLRNLTLGNRVWATFTFLPFTDILSHFRIIKRQQQRMDFLQRVLSTRL